MRVRTVFHCVVGFFGFSALWPPGSAPTLVVGGFDLTKGSRPGQVI
jgi:hypothetical protein